MLARMDLTAAVPTYDGEPDTERVPSALQRVAPDAVVECATARRSLEPIGRAQ